MKGNLWHPLLMTIIAIVSLITAEKRARLLDGNPILGLILLVCMVSWFVYFMQKRKRKVIKR
ncbi:hypothetical protein DWB61_06050 [Ancylomarina euxinus]|uniref:Uncharacterized protein n=1 Tax=Ancylomarina euxinus TaxID=2283627 RepID=A0A425Y472_9BACT|nr:hypothetical protein DWB61_06050 [Ancylomarina euxinus]